MPHREIATAQLLLERRADIEAKDVSGFTALLLTVHWNDQETAHLLLERGADVEAKDERDRTALLEAVRCMNKRRHSCF